MGDTLVLCYHALSETWDAPLSTTPELFGSQVEALAARGYRGVTFSDLVRGDAPRRAVAVTFDDAFSSVAALARPILDRLGWPATVYVPTAFPDAGRPLEWDGIDHWLDGPWAAELECLGWDGLRELADAGWEIGSHTVSHPRLTRTTDEQLARELADSRETCLERLGACPGIAYPYGDVDERVVAAAARAGYQTGAALPARPHAPRRLEWPRVGVYRADDVRRFRLKTSRLVRRLRRLGASAP